MRALNQVVTSGVVGIVPWAMSKSIGYRLSSILLGSLMLSCSQSGFSDNDTKLDVSKIKSSDCVWYDENQIDSYIKTADLPCFKKALEKGLDPNGVFVDKFFKRSTPYLRLALEQSALFFARDSNKAGIMALLLSFGGDVNASYQGKTLIEEALRVNSRYQEVPLFMINFVPQKVGQMPLNPNLISSGGTLLEISIELKNEAYVDALLSKGANAELQTRGLPPLVQALTAGLEHIATSLIKSNASVDVSDTFQNSALMIAMQKQLRNAFDAILAKTALIDQANENAETPLIASTKINNKVYFDSLLPRTQHIDAVDSHKKSAIFYLVQSSDVARTKAAVLRGASVKLMSSDSSTLLHYVRSAELAEFLLSTKKLSVDEMNIARRTPVASAVEAQSSAVAMVLSAHGARLDYRFPNMDSLLHASVRNNDLATTRFLIGQNLEIEAQNDANETPVFGVSTLEMAKLLDDHQANFARTNKENQNMLASLFSASFPSDELLRFVLDHGVTANTYLDNGFTPVHVLVDNFGYSREVRTTLLNTLIKHGASLDVLTLPHRVPALFMVGNDIEWIKYFAQKGANLSIVDGISNRTLAMSIREQIASLEEQLEILKGSPAQELEPYKKRLAKLVEIRDYLKSKNAN